MARVVASTRRDLLKTTIKCSTLSSQHLLHRLGKMNGHQIYELPGGDDLEDVTEIFTQAAKGELPRSAWGAV